MGANIKIEGSRAIVRGKAQRSRAAALVSDSRALASLALAALVADGETIIDRSTTSTAAMKTSKKSCVAWARRSATSEESCPRRPPHRWHGPRIAALQHFAESDGLALIVV